MSHFFQVNLAQPVSVDFLLPLILEESLCR